MIQKIGSEVIRNITKNNSESSEVLWNILGKGLTLQLQSMPKKKREREDDDLCQIKIQIPPSSTIMMWEPQS
jgi:hypothetical protein